MKEKIKKAQRYLEEIGADGWLLYDFHRSNYLAHLFLEIPAHQMLTRRFFYWIPQKGEPIQIVHAIEPNALDRWPGEKKIYLSWQSLRDALRSTITQAKRVAMEYSPMNGNPYVSYVDGGTIDLIRSYGVEVVSSGAFLAQFTSVIDPKQGESHIRAATALDQIVLEVWKWIGDHLQKDQTITEYQVQQKILDAFLKRDLITDSPPIVAVNENSADPHYEPRQERSAPIRKGDFLLIDLWAKEKGDRAVFGDITRVAVASERPTQKQLKVFETVRAAQKRGIDLVKRRFAEKKRVLGCEVDDAVRQVIIEGGYGPFFTHRTGHSIEVHLHGSGTHIDNLEMRDDRPLLPGTCFSIEPGVYLTKEFGIRLESDVYIHLDGRVEVTGGEQEQIFPLLQRV